MSRRFLLFILCTILSGCSAEHYRRSADLDVQSLLRDREKQTLDYTPQVDVPAPIVTTVPRRAYDKIPTSPIPPKTIPPIEIEQVNIPRSPLGPEERLKDELVIEGSGWGQELQDRYHPREPIGPTPPDQGIRQFDLFACLQYAVQHSRSYQDQMDLLYISALDVTLQRHLFTPRPFASTGLVYTGGQKGVDYKSALTVTNTTGIRQKLPYGGEVVASALVDFVNAINGNVNEGESAGLVLSGTLPLLRGFGMVNLEPFIESERKLIYEVRNFEDFRRSFVVDISRLYFNLLAQQQGIRNRRINLAQSTDLRIRSQELYNANRLISLEVQRARQQELQAQSQVIDAEESYQSLLDDFKVALGMPVDEGLDVVPVEMEVSIPRILAEDAIALAHKYRLTLVTAADEVNDAMRAVKNSRNALLPNLDFNAQVNLGNEKDTPAVDLQSRTLTYQAGLTLDLPIDRLAERNDYRKALIALQKAERNLGATKDKITADVRDALRSIRAAEISLEIQRLGIDLAQRRVEFANLRLTSGQAKDNRDVVEAQNSLLDAQDRYERARSQLQITVLQYMRDTGTLRVDPQAGTIGRVMDRAISQANNSVLQR